MPMTLQQDGRLHYTDKSGHPIEIGPEHPDYQRYYAQYRQSAKVSPVKARLLGLLCLAMGIGAFWYEWHQLTTGGRVSVKLGLLGPLGLFGGLLTMAYPEALGPLRPDSPQDQKRATYATMAVMVVAWILNAYFMETYRP